MNSKTLDPFYGPLFIVGMPRSGTKLLRTALNEHPKISIPIIETDFLPFWIVHWTGYGDISLWDNFQTFYTNNLSLPYFQYMKEDNQLISAEEWFSLCNSFDLPSVFEALMRHDAKVPEKSEIIWGDKTPSYINHIPTINRLYPQARVIHIVRDVRDYCLSINEAWGKNILRAAQRWNDSIQLIQSDASLLGKRYYEVRYEDLLANPENKLHEICDFLGLPYQKEMMLFSRSSENIGRAKHLLSWT